MYLTKLTIDKSIPEARNATEDMNAMHKMIMKAFSNNISRKVHRVLFRVEQEKEKTVIYVMSLGIGNWDVLKDSGFNVVNTRNLAVLMDNTYEGDRYRFNIAINPKQVVTGGGSRVLYNKDAKKWLEEKAKKSGFRIVKAYQKSRETLTVERSTGTFNVYREVWTGELEVTDRTRFWDTFQDGIGPGKPYGCGMMLLKSREPIKVEKQVV